MIKQRPLIFLDLDGVLNSAASVKNSVLTPPSEALDRTCITVLNEIVRRTKAQVVISSSWRLLHPLAEIRRALQANGYDGDGDGNWDEWGDGAIIGATPDLGILPGRCPPRGYEIWAWLESHISEVAPRYPGLVILDDCDAGDMALMEQYHIQTDPLIGLTPAHIKPACKLLMRDWDGQ